MWIGYLYVVGIRNFLNIAGPAYLANVVEVSRPGTTAAYIYLF
jgi:hypothetical protein